MSAKIARRDRNAGFTLIELLVVVAIIAILLAILIPAAALVKKMAMKADTSAEIQRLQIAIQNYFQDFNSYPGPIPESQIYGNQNNPSGTMFINMTTPIPGVANAPPTITAITSSQNLFLALSGGLDFSSTIPPNVQYDVSQFGKGPMNLNLLNPHQYKSYLDAKPAEIANDGVGHYMSWTATNPINPVVGGSFPGAPGAPTFIVPEYLDHFPNAHPIIYLRAIVGASGIADNFKAKYPPVDYTLVATVPTPYYSMEMSPYWIGPGPGPNYIPTVGAPLFFSGDSPGALPPGGAPPGGLGTPPPPGYSYTDAYSFFQNPSMQDSPRNKDSYMLISAGYDGIYGTPDDVIYPPN